MALLRRVQALTTVVAVCCTLGTVGFWALTGLMHPTLLLTWLALEVAALFSFAAAALLARLLSAALQLRQDHDLTV